MTLTIDVTSDLICPWCYIGKRRLEKAIAAFAGRDAVRVRWHPFQLNPQMPKEGMNRKTYRSAKFGSWERSLALDAQVTEAGKAEGILFDYEKTERTPNTLDGHRLIWLADQERMQDAVVEGLFRAYFTEGRDISHTATLLDVVADAGLDRGRADAMLKGYEGIEAVRELERHAQTSGVRGVPYFIVNGKFAVSGAQDAAAFLEAFNQAGVNSESTEGSTCTIGEGGVPSC